MAAGASEAATGGDVERWERGRSDRKCVAQTADGSAAGGSSGSVTVKTGSSRSVRRNRHLV